MGANDEGICSAMNEVGHACLRAYAFAFQANRRMKGKEQTVSELSDGISIVDVCPLTR